jgi:hypothetical protein
MLTVAVTGALKRSASGYERAMANGAPLSSWSAEMNTAADGCISLNSIAEQIGPDIWIVEGSTVRFLGLALGTRMTIVRLSHGGVWLHSPIAFTPDIASAVASLGDVTDIVAPNKYHHLFLKDWVNRYPNARVYGAPGLRGKRRDIHFDADLPGIRPAPWETEISLVLFSGNRLFDEVIFFHRSSRIAILTDLIVNVRLHSQPWIGRAWGWIEGVGFPNGRTPLLYRLNMNDRAKGRRAIEQLFSWQPQSVVISHGEWFRSDGLNQVRERFQWLLK